MIDVTPHRANVVVSNTPESTIYVEISTLFDETWSGIANVTANLCRALLKTHHSVRFFAFDKIIERRYVANALAANDGTGLHLLMDHGIAVEQNLQTRKQNGAREVAIFPNFKRGYQDFEFEVLIIHDLSFILMPEFHEAHRVHDYKARLFRDVHDVNKVVCVSNATREDVLSYYRVPPSKVSVAYLGADCEEGLRQHWDDEELERLGLLASRYFLILGTIEPRKNVELIIEYIDGNRAVLNSYKFVFAGRQGWGRDFQSICAARGMIDARIVHLDYVSELQRKVLLRNSAALLFPSWFEGFGLPVLESMASGSPVLGSRTSSVVEVGGDAMIGFDPGSVESFAAAIDHFRRLSVDEREDLSAACRAHASRFTWAAFRDAILAVVPAPDSTAGWGKGISVKAV